MVCGLLLVAGCTSAPGSGGIAEEAGSVPQATSAAQTETASPAIGVALSPRSYEGSDLPDFLEIVDGEVDVLMHAGDWGELAKPNSSFEVLAQLAAQQDTDVMIVLSPTDAEGLIRPLDEPTIASYLTSLESFVTEHRPRYLGLANEINLAASRDAAGFEATVALWNAALPIVREHSPDTDVFVTFAYEWMRGNRAGFFGGQNDPSTAQWDLIGRFADADAVGITTYPSLVFDSPADLGVDYYAEIADHTDLPVLITESGWTADETLPILAGSEEEQAEFVRLLRAQPALLDIRAMVWTFLFATQVSMQPFNEMGLWRNDGTPRPAWGDWTGAVSPATAAAAADIEAEPISGFTPAWSIALPGDLPLTTFPDAAQRPFLYVAAKQGGLVVIDTEAQDVVGRLGRNVFGADVTHLDQQGDLLVASLGDFFAPQAKAGLATIDVSDPTNPQLLGLWLSGEPLKGSADVRIDGQYAYLAAMHHGVFVFDLSEPGAPTVVAQFVPDQDFPRANPSAVARPNARGLAVDGDRLYVAYDAGGLRILDVADPAHPIELGRYINAGATKQQAYNDVVVRGSNAYVSLDYCGFEVIDISDPTNPRQRAWLDPWDCNSASNLWFNSPGHLNELHLDDERQTMWVSAGDSELVAIDVSDPAAPSIIATHGGVGDDRGSYGLGATNGGEGQIYLTYITTVVPFQGRTTEIVALTAS